MSAGPTLAARAVAAGPPTLAPPSFNGEGWLYVLILFEFTAGFALLMMLAGKLAIDMYRCWRAPADSPDHDDVKSPIMLHRLIGLLWSAGFALRCGVEAQLLWRWNPLHPRMTATAMVLKRVLDPIAFNIGILGIVTFYLSLPGVSEQLRKEPFPINMWTSLPLLKRPGEWCYVVWAQPSPSCDPSSGMTSRSAR